MLNRLAIAVAGLLILSPLAASAHGPTRQKVNESVEINASADKVWAVIGNFQDMSWLPVVAKTEGKGGNDVNATRTLTLKSGGTINELLDKYDAADHVYAYEMVKVDPKVFPVHDYSSRITVTANGDKSTVEWHGAFYRGYMLNDPPPELNDEVALKAVTKLYKEGLAALKTKIESGG